MTPAHHKADRSIAGPLLVLLAGLACTGLLLFQLIGDLRLVFAGVPAQATVTRFFKDVQDRPRVTIRFTDEAGHEQDAQLLLPARDREQRVEGDALAIRYLPGDPSRVCLETEVHAAWPWKLAWVVLGLGVTTFGVLLTWGRWPRRPGRWRSSPDRPW